MKNASVTEEKRTLHILELKNSEDEFLCDSWGHHPNRSNLSLTALLIGCWSQRDSKGSSHCSKWSLYQSLYILHILAMKALLAIYSTTEYSELAVTHKDHWVQLLSGWSVHPGSNPQPWCCDDLINFPPLPLLFIQTKTVPSNLQLPLSDNLISSLCIQNIICSQPTLEKCTAMQSQCLWKENLNQHILENPHKGELNYF